MIKSGRRSVKSFIKLLNVALFFFFLFFTVNLFSAFPEQKQFSFSEEPIDVVIPCCGKDIQTLNQCIKSVKKYVQGVRRIIVVSPKRYVKRAEWFDERKYPFTKESIALQIFGNRKEARHFVHSPKSRVGWIYQQLLKLYAAYVIPGLSSNVLVVDSDLIFLNAVSFLSPTRSGLYAYGREYHWPYFDHMGKLLPGLGKLFANYSGIAHHMLFQAPVLDALFKDVETVHGKIFWQAFCDCIDEKFIWHSCASEYEIYFNYLFTVSSQALIRPLKWTNIDTLNEIPFYKRQGYHYVACHAYLRE